MTEQTMFYVAVDRDQPGAAWAACVDKPEYAKDTAKDIADWIKRGASIERVNAETMQSMLAAWVRPAKKIKRRESKQAALTGA